MSTYGRQRKHDHGVGNEVPFNTLASAIGGTKQRGHTFEERHDEHP